MEEMKRIEAEVRSTANDTRDVLNEATIHPKPLPPDTTQPKPSKVETEDPAQASLELTSSPSQSSEPDDSPEVENQPDDQGAGPSENRPPPANEANG